MFSDLVLFYSVMAACLDNFLCSGGSAPAQVLQLGIPPVQPVGGCTIYHLLSESGISCAGGHCTHNSLWPAILPVAAGEWLYSSVCTEA